MSYQGIRAYNFCRNLPGSPGCALLLYGPPTAPAVDPCADPYAIGTTSCKQYRVYVNALPSTTNPDNLISQRTPIVQAFPTTGAGMYLGFTNNAKLNLYSVNRNGVLSNKIGFLSYNVVAMYDTPSSSSSYTGAATITANVTVNWLDGTNLRATAQAQFTYHLNSTASGTGYPGPLTTNTFSAGQQLYGKTLRVDSSVTAYSSSLVVNQLLLTIL